MAAIQDLLPNNHCYGCGADNPRGMQLKSFRDGDVTRATYMPKPEQSAGPLNYVYGGTIASLIDCHCVGSAIAHQYALEGREIGEGEPIWCVTGRLTVNYLAPTPIDQPIELVARVVESEGKKTILNCTMTSGDVTTAEGEVIAIRVPPEWRDD